jgi:hypothetical protein
MSFAGTGRFPDGLRAQSRWSAAAALCAAIAAFVQAAALAYPVLARWIGHALQGFRPAPSQRGFRCTRAADSFIFIEEIDIEQGEKGQTCAA